MTDKVQKIREEVERLKEETSIGLSEYENGVEQGRMEIINALSILLDSMQEEPVTSVWHDSNTVPVAPDKNHLWVVVSFKNGDITTCFIDTLITWQRVQREAIDCWAYREDLLEL